MSSNDIDLSLQVWLTCPFTDSLRKCLLTASHMETQFEIRGKEAFLLWLGPSSGHFKSWWMKQSPRRGMGASQAPPHQPESRHTGERGVGLVWAGLLSMGLLRLPRVPFPEPKDTGSLPGHREQTTWSPDASVLSSVKGPSGISDDINSADSHSARTATPPGLPFF